MLDFKRVKKREIKLPELVADLSVNDLRDLTNEMIDDMLARIEGCVDADVVFEPEDRRRERSENQRICQRCDFKSIIFYPILSVNLKTL